MTSTATLERTNRAVKLNMGKRCDFERVEFENKAGLKASFF